jgi:hypothetical protein
VLAEVDGHERKQAALGWSTQDFVVIYSTRSGGTPSVNLTVAVTRRKQTSWKFSEIVGKACTQCIMAWKATSRTWIGTSSCSMSTP